MPFLEFYHEAGQWAAATVFEAVQQTLEETLPCLLQTGEGFLLKCLRWFGQRIDFVIP